MNKQIRQVATAAALLTMLGGGVAATAPAMAAEPAGPAPADALAAIIYDNYLPDYQHEFFAAVDQDNIWNHDVVLSDTIGARVAGTSGEDAGIAYVRGQLESWGYQTSVEAVPLSSGTRIATLAPSRPFTGGWASWSFRPSTDSPLVGADNAVSGPVIDIGAAATAAEWAQFDLAGKIVLANWNTNTTTRTAIISGVNAAGAAGLVFLQSAGTSQSLPGTFTVTADNAGFMAVAGSLSQGQRLRAMLAEGPLSLSITTEMGRAGSSNIIGVLPAANGDPNAPIIYIGAHVDSVLGSPGASDNGSGTSIMLELARIFSHYNFDTEFRVGGWGAEERGIVGSSYHVNNVMTDQEIARTIGAWNMDMAGTNYPGNPGQPPFSFTALAAPNATVTYPVAGSAASIENNIVLGASNEASNEAGLGNLTVGTVSRSDHQAFHDAGIPAAVFSWMYWAGGTNIILEPAYHQTTDTLDFVSAERMGIAAEILGGGAFRTAMNEIDLAVTDPAGAAAAGVEVALRCEGDQGWRPAGTTDADGHLVTIVPHATCDLAGLAGDGASGAALGVAFDGDGDLGLALVADQTAAAAPGLDAPEVHNSKLTERQPVFSGVASEPGGVITVWDGDTVVCTATPAFPDNAWSCTAPAPLADGKYDYTVTQTDLAGNVSPAVAYTFRVQGPKGVNTSPDGLDAPILTSPKPGDALKAAKVSFAGSGVAGTTVRVTDATGASLCTTAVGPSGTWNCQSASLANGTYTVTAVQQTSAGVASGPSSAVTFAVASPKKG